MRGRRKKTKKCRVVTTDFGASQIRVHLGSKHLPARHKESARPPSVNPRHVGVLQDLYTRSNLKYKQTTTVSDKSPAQTIEAKATCVKDVRLVSQSQNAFNTGNIRIYFTNNKPYRCAPSMLGKCSYYAHDTEYYRPFLNALRFGVLTRL